MAESPSLPLEFVTMSSVRQDPSKRGVPMDAATFLVESNALGKRMAENSADSKLHHIHLIGDVSVLAEKVALEHIGNPRGAIEALRDLLLNAATHPFENELRPLVEEKVKVYKSMAARFGVEATVISAIAFLRKRRQAAITAMSILAGVYNERMLDDDFDLKLMGYEIDGISAPEDYTPHRKTLRDLARESLPASKRKKTPDAQQLAKRQLAKKQLVNAQLANKQLAQIQLAHSFYGGSEGATGAAVIDQGGIYASYCGSEKAGENPIIENMKTLIQTAVFFVLQNTPLTKSLDSNFILDDALDGLGMRIDREKGAVVLVHCDPHTLDSASSTDDDSNGSTPPQKLPLLQFQNDAFSPVTRQEVENFIVNPSSAGITGHHQQVYFHSLPAIYAYLSRDEIASSSEIHDLLTRHGINREDLDRWLLQVKLHLNKTGRSERGDKNKTISPIAPGGKISFIGDVINKIALDILRDLEQ